MTADCTALFLHYREIVKLTWNLGFHPNIDNQTEFFNIGDRVAAFQEAMARLYEGLVLLPLGHFARVEQPDAPGRAVPFRVELKNPAVECLVDARLPDEPGHPYKVLGMPLLPGSYEFEFVSFFDWDQLAKRDLGFIQVLIKRMDPNPATVGHHALIPTEACIVIRSE